MTPNTAGTPVKCFRIHADLYEAARAKATAIGADLSTVVRNALDTFVHTGMTEVRMDRPAVIDSVHAGGRVGARTVPIEPPLNVHAGDVVWIDPITYQPRAVTRVNGQIERLG